ncbi:phenylacetate--CoA ligase family protein [Amycolatopsis jejuensis]|uniref:phenylacetate--CoA ligase family protein n=1 Tax=Amycolatopsis jejuensis TaxID=330084 RepID=UPI000AF773E5|nr:phenylacetate--CoA ligase family protein [Amycolatopsis jejuensis]
MTSAMNSAERRSLTRRDEDYRRYWDPLRETMDPDARASLILERVQHQLHYVYETIPFYRRHYEAHGFHPDSVKSLDDFTRKVPVITKKMLVADQAEHPPFGSYLGVAPAELARIHGSSGTSGIPTMYGISRRDWERSAEVCRIALWSAGVRPDDIVQISFPFGLFLGGWGLLQACEVLGACAFPVGSLMPTDQQLTQLARMRVDALVATPSYAQHLGRRAAELGIDLSGSHLGVIIVAGEPGGSIPEIRKAMSEGLGGAAVVDLGAGASSEMHPFYANVGCRHAEGGVHLVQDENYTEVVGRDDPNVPIPVGESGAVVATHLWRESQPMIRFWLGDEGHLDDSPCACGRTFPRLPRGVYGRLDDMLLIRGANVYPSAIDAIIRETPGTGREYRIRVTRSGELDEMRVEVERAADAPPDRDEQLRHDLAERLRAGVMVRTPVDVVAPDTFDVQMFKARRVIDERLS